MSFLWKLFSKNKQSKLDKLPTQFDYSEEDSDDYTTTSSLSDSLSEATNDDVYEGYTTYEDQDGLIHENNHVMVYVNGSSSTYQNRKIGGIGVWWNYEHKLNAFTTTIVRHTRNAAEIQACTKACQIAIDNNIKRLKIKTKSKFVTDCITKFIYEWKQNGWKTRAKKSVINRVDIMALDDAIQQLDSVIFETIYVRDDCQEIKYAVELARRGLKMNYDGLSFNNNNNKSRKTSDSSSRSMNSRKVEPTPVSVAASTDDESSAIGIYWHYASTYNVSELHKEKLSQNAAELDACIKAMNMAINKRLHKVIIKTSAKFIIDCVTLWHNTWSVDAWKNVEGYDLELKDKMLEVIQLLKKSTSFTFTYIPVYKSTSAYHAAKSLANAKLSSA